MNWFVIFTLLGCLTDYFIMKYLNSHTYPWTVIFSLLCCIVLLRAFDDPLEIAKGCIFSQSLLAAGYIDHKTGEIPDALCFPIVLCGFIEIQPLSSLEGAALLFLVLLAFRLLFNCTGGGDIKLLASCGWALGLYGALGAALICYFLFFFTSLLMKRGLKSTHPMGPFIAIGCITAFLIS